MRKFLNFRMIAILMVACLTTLFLPSCGNDDEDKDSTPLDLTEINALLSECESLLSSATTDDYPEAAITTFQSKVNAIKSAVAGDLTQTTLNNLLVQLKEAKTTFEQSAYDAIPLDNLLAEWSFDEGEGTSLVSTGVQAWVAKMKTGPSEIFGTNTQVPSFVDGVKGKALSFDNGACLEVDDFSETSLLSNTLSISVWINPKESRAGNYILSMNYWENWKLNLQNEGKPFFTVATTVAGVDADNEHVESFPINTWTHLVVSMDLNAHTLCKRRVDKNLGCQRKTGFGRISEICLSSCLRRKTAVLDRLRYDLCRSFDMGLGYITYRTFRMGLFCRFFG